MSSYTVCRIYVSADIPGVVESRRRRADCLWMSVSESAGSQESQGLPPSTKCSYDKFRIILMCVFVCECTWVHFRPSSIRLPVRSGRSRSAGWASSIGGTHSGAYNSWTVTRLTPSTTTPSLSSAQILTQHTSLYPKCLKEAHINAESLRGLVDEIRAVFQPQHFDLIGIYESWLNLSIPFQEVSLMGYTFIRNDRTNEMWRCSCVCQGRIKI